MSSHTIKRLVFRLHRLGPKLTITVALFLGLLALVIAITIQRSLRETQDIAARRSSAGLEAQGHEHLRDLIQREAHLSAEQFNQAATATRYAAHQLVALANLLDSTDPQPSQLARGRHGHYIDTTEDRQTDLLLYRAGNPNAPTVQRQIRHSRVLDAFFPTLLAEYPHGVGIYYISPDDLIRYYPAIGLADLVSASFRPTNLPGYTQAAPVANPARQTIWTSPNRDLAGSELIVTASTPIYAAGQFQGAVAIDIDITLTHAITRLKHLKPTLSSYAFLVNREGRLIAGPPPAVHDLVGRNAASTSTSTDVSGLALHNPQLLALIKRNEQLVQRFVLNDRQVFLALAPIDTIGWTLGIVAPVDEVIAQSSQVSNAITEGTNQAIRSVLVTMAPFFLVALAGILLLSRHLSRRIHALAAGTRAIANGDFTISVPITSPDELGMLERNFNHMVSNLHSAQEQVVEHQHTLEACVAERTHNLQQTTEELRLVKEVAEEANRTKSTFLATMSHELRTPLNAIINFTRILMSGMKGPINEEQQAYLNRVRLSGEHLLGMINDILDLAKIEAGRLELFPGPVHIGQLVESMLSTVTVLLKDKPVELIYEAEDDLPLIEADQTRLRQVLLELLSNAAKFTNQGSITVRVERIGSAVMVSVADTGIGIPVDHQVTIFEEFRQVQDDSNRQYQGTGLGLAICRRLIDLHGGHIWVESTPSQGSTFYFSLPIPELGSRIRQATSERREKDQRVLIIDDDSTAIEIMELYLQQDGYTVHSITDSRQALETARRLQPMMIILDVLMPYKDGWDVLTELKADQELQNIPVVLYTIVENRQLGLYLGASAYLLKPVREDQLRMTVSRFVTLGATIAVIDDDPNAREIVTQQLTRDGSYRVVTASNGREGLVCIAEKRPDLVILDLMMPELDGFAVLQELDQDPATHNLPVVVLTAKDLTPQEHTYLNERVELLMRKEMMAIERLPEKIAQILGTS